MFKISFHIECDLFTRRIKHRNDTAATQSHNLLQVVRHMADSSEASRRYSTLKNYMTAVLSLTKCVGDNVTIEQIDGNMIMRYQAWLKQQGVCLNTISCYMRSLRTVYNRATIELQLHNNEPFSAAFTGRTKTDKRAITEDNVKAIAALDIAPNTPEQLTRDLFLFSIYAMGMPFVDMAFLKRSQIEDDHFTYFRHKTGQPISVHIEPCMKSIINRYAHQSTAGFVFPLFNSDAASTNAAYAVMLARYNRQLAVLAQRAGLPRLTSYTARHTWASIAFKDNIDLNVIATAMGHTNTKTTLVYVKEINDFQLSSANAEIIRRLNGK